MSARQAIVASTILLLPTSGLAQVYEPMLRTEAGGVSLKVPVLLATTAESVGRFPVDRYGEELDGGVAVGPRLRLGLLAQSSELLEGAFLSFEYEHDVIGGIAIGRPELGGEDLPSGAPLTTIPRKILLTSTFSDQLHVVLGLSTSQNGLGLIANGGPAGWEPFGARFDDPRAADRVLRAAVGFGPTTDQALFFTLAGDYVVDDDIREAGDTAFQTSLRVEVGKGGDTTAGLTVAYRNNRGDFERAIDAAILDLYFGTEQRLGRLRLKAGAEVVSLLGQASVAPTTEHPDQTIRQLGAAVKSSLRYGPVSAHLDLFYGSGDSDSSDELQTAFRADPSFGFGLILFRQVLQAQSGRAQATASDPLLVGQAAPGLERFPNRGSVTNAIAVFPRLGVEPLDGLEIQGGPMFAFSAATLADPLNTRIAGGTPRNALDGEPGRYLGTELDLAIRYTSYLADSELVVGLEGGLFLPGSAFDAQQQLGTFPAGRAIRQYRR